MIPAHKIDALPAHVGRGSHIRNSKQFMIGFTQRELKRRDVRPLVEGQPTFELGCGSNFWMAQYRTWFKIRGTPREATAA